MIDAEVVKDVAVMTWAGGVDLATTHQALAACPPPYCREAAPWMREPGKALAFKAASVGALTLTCSQLRKHGHPKSAKFLRWAAFVGWGLLSINNATAASRSRR